MSTNITLEKAMYKVPGKSFTEVLEELDSSENYRGTELEGLDAYQRQLKRFGIRVSGRASDRVEKFFETGSSAALFPEYILRAVKQGMDSETRAEDISASVTTIDALDYRPVSAAESGSDSSDVSESGSLPELSIKLSSGLISLKKRGRIISSSYEALRLQKLDILTVALRQVGAFIAREQMNDAVSALVNGDGITDGISFTSATPDYSDFIGMWGELSPYKLNTIIAGTAAMEKLLSITEFKDANAGLNFQGSGKLITPLGARLVHAPNMEAGKIIGLDKNCALEMVQAGDLVCDYDKLIDRQLERTAVSATAGFARLYAGAAKGIAYTA